MEGKSSPDDILRYKLCTCRRERNDNGTHRIYNKVDKVKNAIVTGAKGGIGKSIIERFAKEGVNCWACIRKKDEAFEDWCQELAQINGVWIKTVSIDLYDEDEIKHGIKDIIDEKLPIDVLVNNAGVSSSGLLQMVSMQELKSVFQVNYYAPVQIAQMVSKRMIRQKSGVIINMASVGGIEAGKGYLAYGSSKAALIWATRMMANELGVYGIRVNGIAPGSTDTDMLGAKNKAELERVLQRVPLGRVADPKEIAAAVSFLSSDEAGYITGEILKIDGGRTA